MVFLLSGLWWIRIRGLWKPPGKLGLVLMGGAMLSKSLIQFYVDGQGRVLSLLFVLRPNYSGVMKIMETSFKRTCAHNVAFSAPNSAADHCWLTPQQKLLDTQNLAKFLTVSNLGATWLGDLAQGPSRSWNQIHAGAAAIRRLLWGLTQQSNSQNSPS